MPHTVDRGDQRADHRRLAVPLIDISALQENPSDPKVVALLARACREWGFFQIVGHGAGADQITSVWRETHDFFRRPLEEKLKVRRTRENPWGFYDRELTKNRPDQKEVFDFSVEDGAVASPFAGSNQWPASMAAFRSALLTWFDACAHLSERLLLAISAGLDWPASTLATRHRPTHTSFMRLNYYPVRSDATARDPLLGIHPHSDAGTLTILLQDDVPGLEVERDGAWYPVDPSPGALVVNIGDMLQVWSNDRYEAPLHRVLPSRSRVRYSIPFFYNPSYDADIKPLGLEDDDALPRYRAFTWGEFRTRRAEGDFADYGAEVQISDYRVERRARDLA